MTPGHISGNVVKQPLGLAQRLLGALLLRDIERDAVPDHVAVLGAAHASIRMHPAHLARRRDDPIGKVERHDIARRRLDGVDPSLSIIFMDRIDE